MNNLLVVYVSHNRGGKNKWVTFNGQDKRPKPSTTVPVHISLFVFHRDFQKFQVSTNPLSSRDRNPSKKRRSNGRWETNNTSVHSVSHKPHQLMLQGMRCLWEDSPWQRSHFSLQILQLQCLQLHLLCFQTPLPCPCKSLPKPISSLFQLKLLSPEN